MLKIRHRLSLRSQTILRSGFLLFCFAFCLSSVTAQYRPSVTVKPADESASAVLLMIDGKIIDVDSLQVQRGQQVMIWIRDLEKLGWGTVESIDSDRVLFKSKSVTLTFVRNKGVAMVNSLAVRLPIDTYTRNGKFFVPLSFVAKALGYRYDFALRLVASVDTTTPADAEKNRNTLRGKVTYGGVGVAGVVVRVVDRNFVVVGGASAKTDETGQYVISGLPDGEYMVYVYTGDNPAFFNRASKLVKVSGGETHSVDPISLGRIVTPLTPTIGDERVSLKNDSIIFKWKPIDKAVKYKIIILEPSSGKQIYSTESTKPEVCVTASKFRPGTAYEAQVTALDANGEFLGGTAGLGGKPWRFTTAR
jgi:hypothetical protein